MHYSPFPKAPGVPNSEKTGISDSPPPGGPTINNMTQFWHQLSETDLNKDDVQSVQAAFEKNSINLSVLKHIGSQQRTQAMETLKQELNLQNFGIRMRIAGLLKNIIR
eukprot:Lithocolla_globosa_v1_NODE_508_length_3874_cov_42.660382.p4 type:complete len:108 gc:universal NODE_508_length_3874_cov_42.660382:375-698(+)